MFKKDLYRQIAQLGLSQFTRFAILEIYAVAKARAKLEKPLYNNANKLSRNKLSRN